MYITRVRITWGDKSAVHCTVLVSNTKTIYAHYHRKILQAEFQDPKENTLSVEGDFGTYPPCSEPGSMPLNLNPPDAFQALPPISSFRAPLQVSGPIETLNPDPCNYVPDFSDLYQENPCMWQPLFDAREQSSSNVNSDLEYLLERAGLYSQSQQPCPVGTMEQYRAQQWNEQSLYEASYLDLQSKTSYASGAYSTPPQLYQSHANVQQAVGHVSNSYPIGYPHYSNPYPDYLQTSSQSYVPQGFLRNTWEQQPEQRTAIGTGQEQPTEFIQEESLLKQYLLLPSHELGQITGNSVLTPRQSAVPRTERPQLVQRRPSHPSTATTRNSRPKSPPSATVTSSTSPISSLTPSAVTPQVHPPAVSVVPARTPPTFQVQEPTTTAPRVPQRCAPVVTPSLLRPATSSQSSTQMLIYWSALARAAATAGGTASNTQLTPLVLQGPVSRTTEVAPNVVVSAVPPPPRPRAPRRGTITSALSIKKTTTGTIKRLLRKKSNRGQTSILTTQLPSLSVARLVESVQAVRPYPIPTTSLLGDRWKVHVSPVFNIRPNSAMFQPPNKGPRPASELQSGGLPEKRIRLNLPSTSTSASTSTSTSTSSSGYIPPFEPGRINAKQHRPRHFEMGRLQIGNFLVLSGQLANGKYINRLKAIFTKRRFVYEFETIVPPSPGSGTGPHSLQTGLFCVVVPFSTVTALRCEGGTQVRLLVDRQPLMFLGSRRKRQGVIEMPIVYDTSKPVDITDSQLKRSPLHLISLKPPQASTLQYFLWNFSDRFMALSRVEIPIAVHQVELPPPEAEIDLIDTTGQILNQSEKPPKDDSESTTTVKEGPPKNAGEQSQSSEECQVSVTMTLVEGELKETTVQEVEPEVSSTCVTKDAYPAAEAQTPQPPVVEIVPETRPDNPDADSSSTEIEEVEIGSESPELVTAVEIREADSGPWPVSQSLSMQLAGTCTCRISCRSQRCSCARAHRMCRVKSGETGVSPYLQCQCSGCDNPLNILVSLGITEDSAKQDHCLMQNVYKLLHLHSYLNQLVTLECCGERAPLHRFLPGVVPCPNRFCKATLQYSWCRQLVCDSQAAPPKHCHVCGLCRFNDTKHCQTCNRCYNLLSANHPCPACTVRATLRARVPANKNDRL